MSSFRRDSPPTAQASELRSVTPTEELAPDAETGTFDVYVKHITGRNKTIVMSAIVS